MGRIKTLIILLLVLTSFHAYAQDKTVTHIVDRGETLASIAKLYGVTNGKLIELNPDASDFVYVGMELTVPCKETEVVATAAPSFVSEVARSRATIAEACEAADRLLSAEEYGKAAKAYSKIIKEYGSSAYSCVDAYYGRALAYYNQGKWKSSIKDFESAIADSRCTGTVRSHCKSLLANARQYREQQLERRGEIWGTLFSSAIVATGAAVVAHQQAKSTANTMMTTQGATSSSYGGSAASGSSYSDNQSYSSSSSASKSCPSLKAAGGKWYCANTGKCGMCNGDGFMDGQFGQGANAHKCTLCGGTGKCKYCQ